MDHLTTRISEALNRDDTAVYDQHRSIILQFSACKFITLLKSSQHYTDVLYAIRWLVPIFIIDSISYKSNNRSYSRCKRIDLRAYHAQNFDTYLSSYLHQCKQATSLSTAPLISKYQTVEFQNKHQVYITSLLLWWVSEHTN